jgi:hypothetical protein
VTKDEGYSKKNGTMLITTEQIQLQKIYFITIFPHSRHLSIGIFYNVLTTFQKCENIHFLTSVIDTPVRRVEAPNLNEIAPQLVSFSTLEIDKSRKELDPGSKADGSEYMDVLLAHELHGLLRRVWSGIVLV